MYNYYMRMYREMKCFEANSKISYRLKRLEYQYAMRAQNIMQKHNKNVLQKRTRQK